MSGARIKICGLFRQCDAGYLNAAKPDYAGFVFCEKSRRYVTPRQARELRLTIDPGIETVGVFVNAPLDVIAGLCRERTVGIVQLHGDEGEDYIAQLRGLLAGVPVWRAFRIRSAADMESAARSTADRVLLDNGYGTGEAFDWSLIGAFPRPFLLAGGLTPENIPDAISRFHPYAVDLSSGVESGGVKDKDRVMAAVKAARGG